MNISDIIKILKRNFIFLILFPTILAALVFYFTQDEKKEYTSNFLIYTGIASGYDLTTEAHPRVDHNAVNNAFDNLLTTLNARETLEEVSVRLLASHLLLEKPNEAIISEANFKNLQQLIPDSIFKKVRNTKDEEEAIKLIYRYKYSKENNPIKSLLNSGNEIYAHDQLALKIRANRKAQSDMVEVSFSSSDPAICQQTLQILSDVFIKKFKEIKRGEINNVVAYFEDQTKITEQRLRKAENDLKDFEVKYRIINFSEQTRGISAGKQELTDNIQKEKLQLSSANAAIQNLESKLNMKKGLMETNDKVVVKREQLADLNYKIANAKLDPSKKSELDKLIRNAEEVKDEIRVIVNQLYALNNSAEGLSRNDLITQWLNNTLTSDESTARLKILEERLKEYDDLYKEYAPLNSTLTGLQREVGVAEKEYLNKLNALNMNKERQQNIEMATNIKIVDKPFYPLSPKPSKRIVLIAGSFFAGFTLLLVGFLAFAFFDNRIKTPLRAEALTGLRVCGALPLVRKNENRFDVEYFESSLIEQAINAIILEIKGGPSTSKTKFIMITSPRSSEGKSWCANKLSSKLSEIKGRVLFMYPQDKDFDLGKQEFPLEDIELDIKDYPITKHFVNAESLSDLLPGNEEMDTYSFVIIEIPPLSANRIPMELVKQMDLSLLVVRADRLWTSTDNYLVKLYTKACNCNMMVFLNAVSPDGLKDIFNGMPKRKTKSKESKKAIKLIGSREAKV